MPAESLWGDIPDADDSSAPVELLREQAAILASETNGELLGEVEQLPSRRNQVQYDLSIVVPNLGDYKHTILYIAYPPVSIYPLEVVDLVRLAKPVTVSNEDEYRKELRKILASSELRRVIAALRRQARQQPA